MDGNLTGVEAVFVQRLSSGEPITRKRALEALKEWIQEQSRTNPFKDADMLRLAKGLHYVMWMQDKMVLQEELADRISGLLNIFKSEEEKAMYIKAMFICLSKEWHKIDRWRMDKFLMLMRRMLRVLFAHLKELGWKKETRFPFWKVFQESTISSDKSFSDGLKFHFASIFLDELDGAGGITKKQMTICLKPFADLLSSKGISEYLFHSIIDEAFMTILHQKSEEVAAEMEEDGDVADIQPSVTFDYKAIGKMLFDVGKQSHLTSERRRKIYDTVKKFEAAAGGADPLHFEPPQAKEELQYRDVLAAGERMKEREEKIKLENAKHKENLKNRRREAHEVREAERKVAKEIAEQEGENEKTLPKKKTKLKSFQRATKRISKKKNLSLDKKGGKK